MNNRKVLIAIIIVLSVLIVALAILIMVNPFKKKTTTQVVSTVQNTVQKPEEEPEEEGYDYESIISDFIAACSSTEDMETFVDDNLDFKSYYLFENSEELETIEGEYKKLDKKTYTDEKFVSDVKEFFSTTFVSEDNEGVVVTEVGKPRNMEPVGVKIWDVVKFVVKADESSTDELEWGAIFYEDKLVYVLDYNIIRTLFSSVGVDVDVEEPEEMTDEEKEEYNSTVESYVGDSVKGSEVTALITAIIKSNESNIDKTGRFISVHNGSIDDADFDGVTKGSSGESTYNDGNDGTDANSLGGTMKVANVHEDKDGKNDKTNVEEAEKAMKAFSQKISSSSNYKVETEEDDGVIYAVYISVAE